MTIRHVHSSSRYDRSPQSLTAEFGRVTAADDPDANLCTYTEVGDPKRADALRKQAKADGWGVYCPDTKTDCAVAWPKDLWTKTAGNVHQLTPKTWDMNGKPMKTVAAYVVLDHKKHDVRLWVSVAHLPSGVQDGDKFTDTDRSRAWRDAVAGWHDWWRNKARLKWSPDVAMLVADWNVDFHRASWRDYVQDVFDSMHLCWRGNMPNGGTHGSRLIDASWQTYPANKCRLLADNDSSDHRPWGQILPWAP